MHMKAGPKDTRPITLNKIECSKQAPIHAVNRLAWDNAKTRKVASGAKPKEAADPCLNGFRGAPTGDGRIRRR